MGEPVTVALANHSPSVAGLDESSHRLSATIVVAVCEDGLPLASLLRAFERLRQASNVVWSKPMIVFEKHSDGHDKLKLAHGGYVGRSAR